MLFDFVDVQNMSYNPTTQAICRCSYGDNHC